MPGTGHSARYKGSISNRVQISPFEQLARWNAQLLGAEGAIPTITGGGGSLEFKKLDASDIDGVMTNPASTAGGGNLDMASFGISKIGTLADVSTISNAGAMTISTSSGGLLLSSGNEIQLQPHSGADIVLECASTGGTGDIILRWPDASGNNHIKIGNHNTQGGNKQVLIMTNVHTAGTSSLHMGSGSLQLASLNSLATTIAGQNTMNLSGPAITIGVGSANLDVKIGTGSSNANVTIGNQHAGSTGSLTSETLQVTGTDRLNLQSVGGGTGVFIGTTGIGGGTDVHVGQLADKIGFFGHGPITRPDVELTSPADTALERSTKINNFMIKMSNQIGGGLGLITTSGP